MRKANGMNSMNVECRNPNVERSPNDECPKKFVWSFRQSSFVRHSDFDIRHFTLSAVSLVLLSGQVLAQVPQGPPAPARPTTINRPPAGQPYGPQPIQPPPPQRTASRQQVPIPPRTPQAPFQLTPQQETDLIRVLRAWEERSDKVHTLAAEFRRWDYDSVFGPRDPQTNEAVPKESKGEIKYAAPDKGLYHITESRDFVGVEGGQRKFQARAEGGEHWVCDGQSIWEYNYEKKQLIERRLPPELQGKAISDGPLPFLFGADADKLLARYWMRVVTPPNVQGQVWLEAYPKHQVDAANFQRATVILDGITLFPQAIEIHLPNGKSRHVHQFHNNVVNDSSLLRFIKGDFSRPALPRGWTKLEDAPRPAASAQASPPRG
jgi:TIGR03009 family protein